MKYLSFKFSEKNTELKDKISSEENIKIFNFKFLINRNAKTIINNNLTVATLSPESIQAIIAATNIVLNIIFSFFFFQLYLSNCKSRN